MCWMSSQVISSAILFLFAKCMLTFAANNDECSSALGMEDGSIGDNQITAKTWLYYERRDSRYYRPYFARLNYKKPSGGWCSADLIDNPEQYVEVDLLRNTKITGIATQGRYNGQEWVEHYKIEYKRYNETRYRRYLEQGKWKVFTGNTDTNSTISHIFNRPLIAQRIKIIPVGNQFTIHCLRFELYGCNWKHAKDGLTAYSAPLGEMQQGLSLQDDTYDGYVPYKATDFVIQGIGKLTDGNIATESPIDGPNAALYTQWVGYRRNPLMFFTFNDTKKFNSISFYVLNEGKKATLFEKVRIEISIDDMKYKHIGSYYPSKEARERQGVLQIKVSLNDNIGSYLRCSFDLNGSWLLITELEFETEPYTMAPTATTKGAKFTKNELLNSIKTEPVKKVVKKKNESKRQQNRSQETVLEDDTKETNDGLSFPIILTIVLVGIVIVFAFFSFIARLVYSSRKAKKRQARDAAQSRNPSALRNIEERIGLNEPPQTQQEMDA